MELEERVKNLEQEIVTIKQRNQRVEADKAWETSWARVFVVTGITYVIATAVFWFLQSKRPWLDALVPTVGFFLSVQSLPIVKQWWIKKYKK